MCLVIAIELSKSINGLEIEYIDIEPLPMLNTDLEGNGTFPPTVEAFRQKIKEADSILFASPEYNFSVSGTPFYTSFYSLVLENWCAVCNLSVLVYKFLSCVKTLFWESFTYPTSMRCIRMTLLKLEELLYFKRKN